MDDRLTEKRELEIVNQLGLHARAAAAFVKVANRYQADIMVFKDAMSVNGKSIMGVLMLAAAQGTIIIVEATGEDAREAVDALTELVSSKFGEPK